jgi:hypothetical protein
MSAPEWQLILALIAVMVTAPVVIQPSAPLKVAMWFRALGLTRMHRWLITSASDVLTQPNQLSAQFRIQNSSEWA